MTKEKLTDFKTKNTREITMPDGSIKAVRMTPDLWEDFEFLQIVEHITPQEMATFALEEVELQDVTFDRAFRGVVAHLANRWVP